MNHLRNFSKFVVCVLFFCVCCQFGCQPQQPFYLTSKGQIQKQYIDKATKIDYPDVDVPSLPEVCYSSAPLTLENPDPSAYWDLTLEEAIQMSLKNSKIIRTLNGVNFSQGGVSGSPSMLLQSPGGVKTVYDPALIESDPTYGQEAALAAFDARLNAGTNWTSSYNKFGSPSQSGEMSVGISKYAATGTRYQINHTNGYQYSAAGAGTSYPWSSGITGGFSHPLLQGGGIEFNRIAGPGAMVGRYNGVAVARINTDMSLNDFEMATRNLVADVEKAYWNLYYAYHRLESVRSGRSSAYETWRFTKAHAESGSQRGRAQYLSQAAQNFFTFQQQTELAQNNLFKAESALRYIMGLTVSDGRMIRPADEPITAPIKLDYHNTLCEALFRSPELRKQKWDVKRRELELTASKNFLLPRLDLEGSFGTSGTGHDLLGNHRSNAYSYMSSSEVTNWSLGLTASAPIGWRQELAGVRNAQLNLAKARAILQEQEFELQHQLGDSFREIRLAYEQMQSSLACYLAAQDEVKAVQSAYEIESTTVDQLLQAQRRLSEAQTGYHSSVVDYNLAIMTLHYRKGSLLEYNNVCLTEGPWPGKAYYDAQRRARSRDAGHYFNYGFTFPNDVSRGTYQQHQNSFSSMEYEELPATLPGEDTNFTIPSAPTFAPVVIESEPAVQIPAPVLPKPSSGKLGENTSVSFIEPEVAPPSALTPARNMRYVK